MTSWDQTGQPMSRRAAREAERRAAEALQERQPHPSGVVDFEAHDFSSDFAPDQDFSVGDTQDIWAALTRGRQEQAAGLRGGTDQAPHQQPDSSAVSGELLDRVRDAVLRRAPEPTPPRPTAAPQQPQDAFETGRIGSRRERRQRETSELREDDLPADLFVDRGPVPPGFPPARTAFPQASPAAYPEAQPPVAYEQPQPPAAYQQPAASGFEGYDYDDDGYYDEPYAPEPTIAIPSLRPMDLETPSSTTNPVHLPQGFAEPVGDDALTFSNPVQPMPVDDYDDYPEAEAAPSFLEPRREAWSAVPQEEEPPAPRPVQARSPFLEPQTAAFGNPELGPPSEVTDLAGFEALIRKARQQPAPQQQPEARPAAWADDDDVQEGFTGLLSRSVQGSHGSSNALMLPADPQPRDVTSAVSGTGDIFVTGSLNLSRSLSTSGRTADHDSRDVDRMFDEPEDEPTSGVAPVRAARAVSGTGESRVIMSGRRSPGNVLPTVLAIVAGVMAVGVVALLVTSWASNLF